MSAYIVGKDHILYLLAAMVSRRICPHGFYWFHGGRTTEPLAADMDKAAELANALWLENIRSVSARYPGESSGTLPGPGCGSYVILATDFSHNRWQEMDPVQVLKAIDAYAIKAASMTGGSRARRTRFARPSGIARFRLSQDTKWRSGARQRFRSRPRPVCKAPEKL